MTTTRTPSPGRLSDGIKAFLADSLDREHMNTDKALALLRDAVELCDTITIDLGALDLSEPLSPRVYIQESGQVGGGEGTHPVTVVLAYLPGPDQVRRFAVWLRIYPEDRDPFTVEGSYLDTVDEAAMVYERRASKIGAEPYPTEH